MLTAGLYYTLRVNRISDFGLYLADEEGNEVLLPNRYVSMDNKVDDLIDVFVYCDSEDRLVATTDRPMATVGEAAYLRVVDKTIHGAFLDWGLKAKDLFLPETASRGYTFSDQSQRDRVPSDHRKSSLGHAVSQPAVSSHCYRRSVARIRFTNH